MSTSPGARVSDARCVTPICYRRILSDGWYRSVGLRREHARQVVAAWRAYRSEIDRPGDDEWGDWALMAHRATRCTVVGMGSAPRVWVEWVRGCGEDEPSVEEERMVASTAGSLAPVPYIELLRVCCEPAMRYESDVVTRAISRLVVQHWHEWRQRVAVYAVHGDVWAGWAIRRAYLLRASAESVGGVWRVRWICCAPRSVLESEPDGGAPIWVSDASGLPRLPRVELI